MQQHIVETIPSVQIEKSIYSNNYLVVEARHDQHNVQTVAGLNIQNLLNSLKWVSSVSGNESITK